MSAASAPSNSLGGSLCSGAGATYLSNGAPYLPDPYPLARGHPREGNGAVKFGFNSLHAPCLPSDTAPNFKLSPGESLCPSRRFGSYGEWWQAHQAKCPPNPDAKVKTKSTSFWPYGSKITTVTSNESPEDYYELDRRLLMNSCPNRPSRRSGSTRVGDSSSSFDGRAAGRASGMATTWSGSASSPTLRRAGSSSALLMGNYSESMMAATSASRKSGGSRTASYAAGSFPR